MPSLKVLYSFITSSYFAAYEVAKKALTPKGADASQLNLGTIILAGGTAGVAMWSIAIPPDVSPPKKPEGIIPVLRAYTY